MAAVAEDPVSKARRDALSRLGYKPIEIGDLVYMGTLRVGTVVQVEENAIAVHSFAGDQLVAFDRGLLRVVDGCVQLSLDAV